MSLKLINGPCLKVLKTLETGSIDCVVTDPPYGYSFMGKDWDKAVPPTEVWKECFRVLKSGAFAFIMSAPRLDVLSQMSLRIEQAGFEIGFTPIFWTYATGFPKAMNVGKAVDKKLGVEREVIGHSKAGKTALGQGSDWNSHSNTTTPDITIPTSEEAKALDGSYAGFQPKPAVEVIIVAMKPLSESTYVDQALKNGKGVTWLDDCRVPINPEVDDPRLGGKGDWSTDKAAKNVYEERVGSSDKGRFPANLIVSDDVLNDGKNHIVRELPAGTYGADHTMYGGGTGMHPKGRIVEHTTPESHGSFSRYFDIDKWAQKTFPFLIVPKASKSERDKGLESFEETETKYGSGGGAAPMGNDNPEKTKARNFHPTVKPLKLMAYLITLGSRPGDVVLDPYVGSGTTVVACRELGRSGIGMEISAEYCEIAKARIGESVEYSIYTEKVETEVPSPIQIAEMSNLQRDQLYQRTCRVCYQVFPTYEAADIHEHTHTEPTKVEPTPTKYRMVLKNGKYILVR